ncbi:MAG: hypothetical protein ACE5OR_03015 [bacterium]
MAATSLHALLFRDATLRGILLRRRWKNVKDVMEMCVEELREENKTLDLRYPEVIAIKHLEVAI